MSQLKVKDGLDIPILGEPKGSVQQGPDVEYVGYKFWPYRSVRVKCLVSQGQVVRIGQPLAEDKDVPGRYFVSPASGVVSEVRRGDKRRLMDIIIKRSRGESDAWFPLLEEACPVEDISDKQRIVHYLMKAGLFAHIHQRPFDRLADPKHLPRSIFVKAVESAPFVPPAEYQVIGYEREFAKGLQILQQLTSGQVHLCYREETDCKAFTKAQGVEKHEISGPHPAGNVSFHIHKIDPIRSIQDVVWTVTVSDVVAIGSLFLHGNYPLETVIAVAGPSLPEHARGYYRVRKGAMVEELIRFLRVSFSDPVRFIAGDPLTGDTCGNKDVIGLQQNVLCIFPEGEERQFLHFFRWGSDKYTASRAYASGYVKDKDKRWPFSTSQHGEERAFVDGSVYERVMPMRILPLQLVRAILGDDRELAEEMGLLEVHEEDFALPEFVCPCKIPMMDIVRQGLEQYCKDTFG